MCSSGHANQRACDVYNVIPKTGRVHLEQPDSSEVHGLAAPQPRNRDFAETAAAPRARVSAPPRRAHGRGQAARTCCPRARCRICGALSAAARRVKRVKAGLCRSRIFGASQALFRVDLLTCAPLVVKQHPRSLVRSTLTHDGCAAAREHGGAAAQRRCARFRPVGCCAPCLYRGRRLAARQAACAGGARDRKHCRRSSTVGSGPDGGGALGALLASI